MAGAVLTAVELAAIALGVSDEANVNTAPGLDGVPITRLPPTGKLLAELIMNLPDATVVVPPCVSAADAFTAPAPVNLRPPEPCTAPLRFTVVPEAALTVKR